MKTFWETSAVISVRVVGMKRSVQTAKNCGKLRATIDVTPQTSLCEHASMLHFSLSAAHQMLKHDLGYHTYKLQIVQNLKKKQFC